MSSDIEILSEQIVKTAGGAQNITSLGACMTRVRFTLKTEKGLNLKEFSAINGVLGYVKSNNQHQLIIGPGKAAQTAAAITAKYNIAPLAADASASIGQDKEVKSKIKKKYANRIGAACAKIGNIFLPLIPAYIGCGLILGVNNILGKTVLVNYPDISALLGVFGNGIFFYLNAIVGYNASKEFGGTPALGVAFAGILNIPALSNISLFGMHFVPGKGGIIAVLLVCYFGALFEKFLKKRLSGSKDMFLTPTLTVLIIGFLSLAAIQPVAGWLSDMLAVYTQKAIQHGGMFTGFILAGTFLPVVMLGIHQSLVPLYQQLIDTLGNNPLFPILCMAGAGQVGASIAVLLKTKNTRLKNIVKNALPVGILGIGEPLIYGVTLPLFKPFITACIGAAFGGAVISALHATAAIPFGVSGIVLLLAMTDLNSTIFYFVGLLTAIIAGFAATWIVGFEDPIE